MNMIFLTAFMWTFVILIQAAISACALSYFFSHYKDGDRLVFILASFCPLWSCYFALKYIIPILKTFKPKEWLKRNFSFKE